MKRKRCSPPVGSSDQPPVRKKEKGEVEVGSAPNDRLAAVMSQFHALIKI
jgi:hypothetical protein